MNDQDSQNHDNTSPHQIHQILQNPQRPIDSPSSTTTYGRVVYLHFACRAALPIGSFLRVTSSQLWAPGSLTPSDPTDAKNIRMTANENALPNNTVDGFVDADGLENVGLTYASSVEMVTSPGEFFA